MKTRLTLLATAVALVSGASIAQASSTDLGVTYVGETGTVYDQTGSGKMFNNAITGQLGNGQEITFDYTVNGLKGGDLTAQAAYKYNSLGTTYYGASVADSNGVGSSTSGSYPAGQPKKGTTSSALVLTTANFANDTGTATITNNSIGTATFLSQLFGRLGRSGQAVITYTVSAVSNVPLPASAPMFGLGLAMLAGLGMMKKSRNEI